MKNKILIYDDNCPLCSWYSGLFVRFGFLTEDGRKSFSNLDRDLLSSIDFDKGRNEIPLVDTSSGKALYGIDALLEILGKRYPLIKKTGNLRHVNWFLKKIYKLVSYNRKLIVARKCGNGAIDCAPDINYFYRSLFMIISLVFNTVMLFPLHVIVLSRLSYFDHSKSELQIAHFALVLINCMLTLNFKKDKAFEYIGQVNMLALTTVLLLLPLMIISCFFLNEWLVTSYLVILTSVILKEYFRRIEYAGILRESKWVPAINLLSINGFIVFLFT